jgi:signal transduction histidine kinase
MPLSKSELIYYLVGATIFLLIIGLFIVSFILIYNRRHRKFMQEQEELKNIFTQTLLQSQLEIREQTLKYIGKELHDNLGLVASLIKINLNTLSSEDPTKALCKIEDTKNLTRQLIRDLKSLSVSLGADRIAEGGLAEALKHEVDRLSKTGIVNASFLVEGNMPDLNLDQATILFRMAQEILNNIIKHSSAKNCNILLTGLNNILILDLSDDGIGFIVKEKTQSAGAGLRNLENRARLINANLILESVPGKGTRAIIELPI